MKIKIIGLTIIVITLLFHGINISLANIAHANLPDSITYITSISVVIGIYIMFSTDEKGMLKRIIDVTKELDKENRKLDNQ
jgi:hypothetical protein